MAYQHVDADNSYCFIVNPAASGGRAGRKWPGLQRRLEAARIDHSVYYSEHRGHCAELARAALDRGHRRFMAVGGDGTANEVLNGLFSCSPTEPGDVSLGIIPWGTGNDWARYYGLGASSEAIVRRLQTGAIKRQDIGKVIFNDRSGRRCAHYFLNCAGTGFDSFLLEKMGTARGSRFRYLIYILKCLYGFRAIQLALQFDGVAVECSGLLLEICLGKYAGGGMQFAPAAVVDNGLFDVLLVDKMSVSQILASLHYIYDGRINEHEAVTHWQCESIRIMGLGEQSFHCDGELVGQLPATIEIIPGALKVIALS